MKKFIVFQIILLHTILMIHSTPNFGYSTLLLAIEETENKFSASKTSTPFIDGIIDGLWEDECIFFDIPIEKPLSFHDSHLDVTPFLAEAKYSGADIILLLKVNYEIKETKGKKLEFKLEEIPFLFYSIRDLKTIKSGKKAINIKETITASQKRDFIKELGKSIIKELY